MPLTSRLTKQRRVIIEILSKAKKHMSASEIFELVKKQIPNISFATVYRNLKFLSENKYVSVLRTNRQGTYYEIYETEHSHFICNRCHKVFDIYDNLVKLKLPARSASGHKILSYCLIAQGLCKKCSRGSNKVKKYVKKIILPKS